MNCLKQNSHLKITRELLKKLDTPNDKIEWWCQNGLEGYPVKDLPKIKGDFDGIIEWLKNIFNDVFYDSLNRELLYKDYKNCLCKKTYDLNGNLLTYKKSNYFSCERTYDSKGNVLSFKNSDGFSFKKTYDSKGRMLSYEDSEGVSEKRAYIHTKNTFSIIKNGKEILSIPFI